MPRSLAHARFIAMTNRSVFRAEQCRLMRDIDAHQVANKSYIEEGIKLLERL